MRHRNRGRKLSRNTEHRRALLRNLVTSLILQERIKTTVAKAKAARPIAERMISLGKRGDLHARRLAAGICIDRKSTRLNSSHGYISYAVFCLKKKKTKNNT